MPIPPPNRDQPAAVCCEQFYGLTEALVRTAGSAVADCLGPNCAGFEYYVSHAEPIGGGDYLAGWLAQVSPSPTQLSPTVYGATPFQLTFGVAVCLSGFPGITTTDGGKISTVPSPAQYMHATYFTYGVAERMWRAVANESVKGRSGVFGSCASVQIGPLIPQSPQDYSARWVMTIGAIL